MRITKLGKNPIAKQGAAKIHKRPFPNHNNDGGKGQVLMVFYAEKEIEGDTSMEPDSEPDHDRMAQQVK